MLHLMGSLQFVYLSMNEKAKLPWEFYNEYERDPATGSY